MITGLIQFLRSENIKYKKLDFYVKALTHTSFVNEQKKSPDIYSYERMEFLGDSILGKIVSEYIYNEYDNLSPGEMSLLKSKLVSKTSLAQVGKKLRLEQIALLGQGDRKLQLSDSVYEDFIESLVAAIYLDVGEKSAKKFILKNIILKAKNLSVSDLKDYKTKIQEFFQAETRKSVVYELVSQTKTKNGSLFKVLVKTGEQILAYGQGRSKKEAEQEAAKNALEKVAT